MAKYRVLPSAAHNYGASFVSVMNTTRDDYAMCLLLRAAQRTGAAELRVNLLTGTSEPQELVHPALAEAIAGYCARFGLHIQRSGAALDMIAAAELRVQIAWGTVVGRPDPEPLLRARLHCEVTIRDDRGTVHTGRAEEAWVCHPSRGYY